MEIITEKNFNEKIEKGLVLVDFFANWCGPCRMMAPVLEDVKKDLGGDVQIFKVDVDEDQNLARQFGVMSIPTLITFVDGVQKEKNIGYCTKDVVENALRKYIKK